MSFPNIYASSTQNEYHHYSLFNDRVSGFLKKAQSIATNIANPITSMADLRTIKEPRISVAYYSLGYPVYSFGNSFSLFSFNLNNYSYGNPRDENNTARVIIGTIGAIVAAVGTYFIGHVVNARNCIEGTLKDIGTFRKMINIESKNNSRHPHLKVIKKIVDCEYNVFKKMEEKTELKLILLVGAAVAGTFIFIGALAASQASVIAGTLLGFGTMLAALFNASYKFGEKSMVANAKTMLAALDTLKNADTVIHTGKSVSRVSSLNKNPLADARKKSSPQCCEGDMTVESKVSDKTNSSLTTSTVSLPVPVSSIQIPPTASLETAMVPFMAPSPSNVISSMPGQYPSPTSSGSENYAIPKYEQLAN